jgi:intracellular sulfur oxidation DsrE/DsrF family protein
MNPGESISDEKLGAFLDGQLDRHERLAVIEALQRDKDLAAKVCELRQDMELMTLAYRSPPMPGDLSARPGWARPRWRIAAAALLMTTGVLGGWLFHGWRATPVGASLQEIAQLDPAAPVASKIIFHLGSLEPSRVEEVLDTVEELLREGRARGKPLRVEVIANAEGLGLLRQGSPYADRIESLAEAYDNVSFLACGIAMENARLSENAEIRLLPEARRVSAALDQILTRLKQGWTYVRG